VFLFSVHHSRRYPGVLMLTTVYYAFHVKRIVLIVTHKLLNCGAIYVTSWFSVSIAFLTDSTQTEFIF